MAFNLSEKSALRREMRARRLELNHTHPDAAERAASWFPVERLVVNIVAGYSPQGGEIDPTPLMRRLGDRGSRLALPVAQTRDAPLVFRAWDRADALSPDVFGIAAPTAAGHEVTPDLIIVPVLAFDAQGGRLGQGGGCYDRTLAALRAIGRGFAIGLAFAGQEVTACPKDAYDQPLDVILTESGYRPLATPLVLR